MTKKKPVAIRFDLNLLKMLDDVKMQSGFQTRTALIEEACTQFCRYIIENRKEFN